MDYLVKAGINPRGMITFFKKLQKFEGRHGGDDSDIFNDHPATSARIAHLEEKLKSLKEPKYKSFANLVKPEALSRESEIDKLVRAKSRQEAKAPNTSLMVLSRQKNLKKAERRSIANFGGMSHRA